MSEQVPPPYLQWPTLAPARAPLGTNPDAPLGAALRLSPSVACKAFCTLYIEKDFVLHCSSSVL
jgi:hypothetical protein